MTKKRAFLVRREGTDVVEGTYRLEEDRIELGNESGTLACDDAHGAGLYRWSWVGQGMFFERLVDTCPGRASALTGGHWRPDPGGLSAGLTRFGLAYDEASSSSSNRCVTCNLGIALPNSGPLASVGNIERLAGEAETLGFDTLLVHDHISYDTEWLGHRTSGLIQPHAAIEPDLYESLTTLAYAAAATRTIRLGTSILVLPLREPRVLARQIITLQALSRGRLLLGVGSGDYPAEFKVMQTPYRKKAAYTTANLEALCAIPAGRAVQPPRRARGIRERIVFSPELHPSPYSWVAVSAPIRKRAARSCSSHPFVPWPGPATAGIAGRTARAHRRGCCLSHKARPGARSRRCGVGNPGPSRRCTSETTKPP